MNAILVCWLAISMVAITTVSNLVNFRYVTCNRMFAMQLQFLAMGCIQVWTSQEIVIYVNKVTAFGNVLEWLC